MKLARRHSTGSEVDLTTYSPVLAFVVLIVFFSLVSPTVFFTTGNLTSILNVNAIAAIVACGLTVVLLGGQFDLSIGSVASISGVLCAGLVAKQGLPVVSVIGIVLVVGIVVGLTNGILVTNFEIPALIVTLAVASVLDGLTLWYTNGATIFDGIPASFTSISRSSVGSVQAPVFYLIGLALVLALIIRYTPAGRYIDAIGGNRDAAVVAGIKANRYVILAFVLSSTCAAFAGLLTASLNGSAAPLFGTNFLLPAFAAAFLGSVTMRRGEFHVLGTIIAVYLIATGTTGFVVLGAPSFVQQIFAGLVLILATVGGKTLTRRRERRLTKRVLKDVSQEPPAAGGDPDVADAESGTTDASLPSR